MKSKPKQESKSRHFITNVRFTQASESLQRAGLLGWISCELNGGFQLQGLTLRRTRNGRHLVGFPARKDGSGRLHFYFKPISTAAQRKIEQQVFRALGIREKSA